MKQSALVLDDSRASALLMSNVLDLDLPSGNDSGFAFEIEFIEGRYYGTAARDGLSFAADAGGQILAVHLHSEGHEGSTEYSERLPHGLAFPMSRLDVRALLGPPARSGDSAEIPDLGRTGSWDLYDDVDRLVHVEYSLDEGRIRMVTLRRRPSDFGEVGSA